jgi:hypothetical protein
VIARRPAGANVRKVALAPLLPKTSTSSLRFVSPFAAGQSGVLPLQHAGLFVYQQKSIRSNRIYLMLMFE